MRRWISVISIMCATALIVGAFAVAAFHPDDGWLLKSAFLWHVLGTGLYVGVLLTVPLCLLALAALVRDRRTRQ